MCYWRWWADSRTQNDRSILRAEWDFTSTETQARYARVLDLVGALRPEGCWGDILELGCAEGFFTHQVASLCDSITACDISPVARSRTVERCAAFGNIRVCACDVEYFEVSGKFDVIFAMGVLEFIPSLTRFRRTASLLAKVLNPRGLLILNACRLPKEVRGKKWVEWIGCGGDQMVDLLSHGRCWRLLHQEFYPPHELVGPAQVEQVIAVFERV
jgi:SAM-dependent methyltransferase